MSEARALDPLDALEEEFRGAWPAAQTIFSPYTRLLPPIYCKTSEDEQREGLSQSFAMIRLRDDRIVISLRQVAERGLGAHAQAILAHEVGHYVHAPGSLEEHIRLHDRIRRTLPGALRPFAGVVANLYTDLLLNDRLQRSRDVNIAAVYAALKSDAAGPLWSFYVRIYERLWGLSQGTLGPAPPLEVDADAELAARLVRLFRQRWMDGAAPFTKLVAPYLESEPRDAPMLPAWLDTAGAPIGDRIPDGLSEDDFDPDEVAHPALDERIAGELDGELDGGELDDGERGGEGDGAAGKGSGRARRGDGRPDRRSVRRGPKEYLELLRASGVSVSDKEVLGRYYRELALPHLIAFPAKRIERAGDPLPEGLDPWEAGSPLERVDWLQTLLKSPVVIPGVTTVERSYGVAEGGEPERRVPDLYVGIDCSGSMGNPAYQLTYPVVAGVVLALSALRAGARVMACLSGEYHGSGSFTETSGFVRHEASILTVLTSYLGTGASFGLPRLAATFANQPPRRRPAHVLIVSDSDLFSEIDGTKDGWAVAKRAVEHAGAGATAVLRLGKSPHYDAWLARMSEAGFETHLVTSEAELVDFARAFARRTFAFDPS
jgi:hypothetical protein